MRAICLLWLLTLTAWATPRVTDVSLRREATGASVDYFRPADHDQHFVVTFDRLNDRQSRIRLVFTGLQTAVGQNVPIKVVNTTGEMTDQATATLSSPGDWPFGNYQLEIYVNGVKVKKLNYLITPPPEQLKVVTATLFRDNGRGGEGSQVLKFSAKDQTLHFVVALNGFPTGKTTIRWTYVAVHTTAGDNVKIGSEERDVSNLRSNTLSGLASMPTDWPRGEYCAEVEMNGRLLTKIPFVVE